MIKANELRIGNWVEANSPMMQVAVIGKYNIELYMPGSEADTFNFDPNEVNPIPLSPDILLSAGFVESKTMMGYIKSYNRKDEEDGEGKIVISHSIDFNCYMISVGRKESIVNLNQIFYLHQLQNLYFALTGEELTINL